MALHYFRIPLKALFLTLILFSSAFSQWKQVFKIDVPVCSVFFTDPSHGVVGTGAFGLNLTLEIWITNNGGITWTRAGVPVGDGEVTQIAINPDGSGYASIFSEN